MSNGDALPRGSAEYVYSRPMVLAATALWLYFTGTAVYWIFAGLLSGHALALAAVLAAVPCLLLLLPFLPVLLHAWRHHGPVIVIDIEGIRDVRKHPEFVPWEDIGHVQRGIGQTAHLLCITFRHSRQDHPIISGWRGFRRLTLWLQGRGEWNISTRLIACRTADVLETARDYRKWHIRRRVLAMREHVS